jgi:hypothetical protein
MNRSTPATVFWGCELPVCWTSPASILTVELGEHLHRNNLSTPIELEGTPLQQRKDEAQELNAAASVGTTYKKENIHF